MSSTIDRIRAFFGGPRRRGRSTARGQVLVIFAFGSIGILAVAALVFDVGQNLFERRKQQDAADASALAGARWLTTAPCKTRSNMTNCTEAASAAMALANTHGYPASQVAINIPPTSGDFAGHVGKIQVAISSNRGSYFAGVVGITSFQIGASAVASNNRDYPFPYSILALNPTGCKSGWAHGNGTLTVAGDLMVNSDCDGPNGALTVDGTGASMVVNGNCATAGSISAGTGALACGSRETPAAVVADPLAGLAGPVIGSAAVPSPPAPMLVTGPDLGSNRPDRGCPGSTSPSTATTPRGCTIAFGSRGKVMWIYPGVYYGGLKITQTSGALTVYMAPGIYYMAGGGFEVAGQPTVRTVDAATLLNPLPTTFGGGALIYNTECIGCGGDTKAIDFQNTQNVQLKGYGSAPYKGMLLWQDRKATAQPALKISGSSTMILSGTIYVPKAIFVYTGKGGTEVLDAQVICDQFEMGGNGNVSVTYDPNNAIKLGAIGLVQ
ncbi:MAG: hypothetical protein H0U52_16825 [Chloroflexi bacterium]|nr:hypothetical protein [Chloroflexota bacterium]